MILGLIFHMSIIIILFHSSLISYWESVVLFSFAIIAFLELFHELGIKDYNDN